MPLLLVHPVCRNDYKIGWLNLTVGPDNCPDITTIFLSLEIFFKNIIHLHEQILNKH